MELAIQKAARTRFGSDNDIRAVIHRESGDINLYKVLKIVQSPENLDTEISLDHAIKKQNEENLNDAEVTALRGAGEAVKELVAATP